MNQFYHFPPKGFIQLGLNLIHFEGKNLTISLKSESIYFKSILRRQNKFKKKHYHLPLICMNQNFLGTMQ